MGLGRAFSGDPGYETPVKDTSPVRQVIRVKNTALRIGQLVWNAKATSYGWFTWLTLLSFLPRSSKEHLDTRGSFHSPIHVLVFAVSALMVCRKAQKVTRRLIPCAAVVCYGLAIEALQSRFNRSPLEWNDVASDVFGVLLFLAAANWLTNGRRFEPERQRRIHRPAGRTVS